MATSLALGSLRGRGSSSQEKPLPAMAIPQKLGLALPSFARQPWPESTQRNLISPTWTCQEEKLREKNPNLAFGQDDVDES